MISETHAAWKKIAEHYVRLATDRASEGLGFKLACLVLAEYCGALWAGTNGPSLAIVAIAERIAERIVGTDVDEVIAAELTTIARPSPEVMS